MYQLHQIRARLHLSGPSTGFRFAAQINGDKGEDGLLREGVGTRRRKK